MEAFKFTFYSSKWKSDGFFFVLSYLAYIDTAEIWLVNLVSCVSSWMLFQQFQYFKPNKDWKHISLY